MVGLHAINFFKFIVHNMIIRKKTIETSNFVVQQDLGDGHLTVSELRDRLSRGDSSFGKKIMYYGAALRGTSQYWALKAKELRSLVQFQINQGKGLPSFFATGSCAEFHFKPLHRLLKMYIKDTTGEDVDLDNHTVLFNALQENTHIIGKYFDLRTQSYFNDVMKTVFGVDPFWYRQEFAKSRGMIHWHGLCWRNDKQPHSIVNEALKIGLNESETADKLSEWAKNNFQMTASHPAGNDEYGKPCKDMWPPPEGTAPPLPLRKKTHYSNC